MEIGGCRKDEGEKEQMVWMEVRGIEPRGTLRLPGMPASRRAPLLCGSGLGACEENPGLRATLLVLPNIAAMAGELLGGDRRSGAKGGKLRGHNPAGRNDLAVMRNMQQGSALFCHSA